MTKNRISFTQCLPVEKKVAEFIKHNVDTNDVNVASPNCTPLLFFFQNHQSIHLLHVYFIKYISIQDTLKQLNLMFAVDT